MMGHDTRWSDDDDALTSEANKVQSKRRLYLQCRKC